MVAVLALGIAVGFKYAIIGKRTPGRYNWDESSYCQRWQVCYLYWYWCLLVKICLIRIQSNKYEYRAISTNTIVNSISISRLLEISMSRQ